LQVIRKKFSNLSLLQNNFVSHSESRALVDSIELLNKNCIKGLPKQVLSVSIYTVKRVIKQFCRKNSKNKILSEYLESAKCMNKAHNELAKCSSKSIDHLLGIQFAVENLKIPMACWYVLNRGETFSVIRDFKNYNIVNRKILEH